MKKLRNAWAIAAALVVAATHASQSHAEPSRSSCASAISYKYTPSCGYAPPPGILASCQSHEEWLAGTVTLRAAECTRRMCTAPDYSSNPKGDDSILRDVAQYVSPEAGAQTLSADQRKIAEQCLQRADMDRRLR